MASYPPFNEMEDQTDADFFDNLVDDDFGGAVGSVASSVAASTHKHAEESDSDEAKAFSNLSIEDEGNAGSEELVAAAAAGLYDAPAKETLAALLNESDAIGASNSERTVSDVLDTGETNTDDGGGRTPKSGVKEVGWASFYADDTMPNGKGNDFGSYSDFFNDFGGDLGGGSQDFPAKLHETSNVQNGIGGGLDNMINYEPYPDTTHIGGGLSVVKGVNGQDTNSSLYWENAYPGWKYDVGTGQWYQVDGYDTTTGVQQGSFDGNAGSGWAADEKTEVNYFQQSSQSAVGSMVETGTTESVSNWNQIPQANNVGYPDHMYFDPQYPGWYYDKNSQEWKSLESYTVSALSTSIHHHDQQSQSGYATSGAFPQSSNICQYGKAENHVSEGYNRQDLHGSLGNSNSSYNQQGVTMWQPEPAAKSSSVPNFGGNQQLDNVYSSNISMNNHGDQHNSFNLLDTVSTYDSTTLGHTEANGFIGSQGFGNFSQQFKQGNLKQNDQTNFSNDYRSSQKQLSVTQHPFPNNQQFSYAPDRLSAGRPSHALVTFGFGGKLIVMKDNSSLGNSSFGNQNLVAGSSISVLNLMEVVSGSGNNASNGGGSVCNYFHALSHQSFSGPLVGGNAGSKELNKWIDERIASCESSDMKLLLSLLKIVFQHYGKIQSDPSSLESDGSESAVAKLFASAKKNGTQFSEYGGLNHCLQNLPSEGHIRATASEVENLLVSGRTKEALQCAQDGQLWGPALVLSSQLGNEFYVDTVKLMARRQLVVGSPLRTLCLLIAGQAGEVVPADTTAVGAPNPSQQPGQFGVNGMLDDWEQNLAVMTANRTKNDDYVMKHLGDCLWRDRSLITAAHICYLVAEEDFKPYSETTRLCLVGSDHLRDPRSYAGPEAIQRTELYEYSKILGNPQFMLLLFQPYKLIYAHMLAEIGKVADALKYCQAVSKSLKAARAPEVELWRQSVASLEERIRTHQQGDYTANLAPAKLVGKLLNFIDTTAHRVVGGLPPPAPSSQTSTQSGQHYQQAMASRVSASQSTMAMSSLMPSVSMEPISGWGTDGNRMTMHNRSVSEPDFGRTPRQVDSSKEETSSSGPGKTSGSVGSSRFPRFGFGSQLLQKTVGLVLRPRSEKQAKLGETNKFYYDEKLKRWVEEGVEPPVEEAALPPPPTTAGFQNGMSDYNLKSALKNDGFPTGGNPTFKSSISAENNNSGIPPIPSSSNQFSARGRMGVRARYVDTFNKGGGSSANSFQPPPLPSVKPAVAANANFFVPAPAPSGHHSVEPIAENVQDGTATAVNPSTSTINDNSFQSPSSLQKSPSMDNMSRVDFTNNSSALQSHSRRTASWSGSSSQSLSAPPKMMESSPYSGEGLGMPPVPAMQNRPPMPPIPINGGSFGDLQEVEL